MALYFAPELDLNETCHELSTIKDLMRCEEVYETEVIFAKRETGNGYFWCTEFQELGEVGESCGKICPSYKPRNGVNGRCKHSSHTYERTEIKKLIILKK